MKKERLRNADLMLFDFGTRLITIGGVDGDYKPPHLFGYGHFAADPAEMRVRVPADDAVGRLLAALYINKIDGTPFQRWNVKSRLPGGGKFQIRFRVQSGEIVKEGSGVVVEMSSSRKLNDCAVFKLIVIDLA